MNNQDKIINNTEGIYLIDAGAGTGKTYTLVKRYLKILEKGLKPENILLVTFTVKAANEMKKRVLNEAENSGLISKIGFRDFIEAPIMTFHSFCSKLLKMYGRNAASFLGTRENISANFRLIEENYYEEKLFVKFYNQFVKRAGKKYEDIIKSVGGNPLVIFKAIKKLSSKGIFPAKNGFAEKDNQRLKGNYEEFGKLFDKVNEPCMGVRGEKQNELYKNILAKISSNAYIDLPADEEVLEGKRANSKMKEKIFEDESQEVLIKFTNEIYYSYIEYLLKRNLLNFDFMVMFAYLLLKNDANVRAANRYDYIMIDEFQDTDEIQFKLMMLLAKENKNGSANLCGVGDWKQGIYGFRNAEIENIIEFEQRLAKYIEELNEDTQRINYAGDKIERIMLDVNYRSSREILDVSYHTLFTEGKKDEDIDMEFVTNLFPSPLENAKEFEGKTEIKFYTGEDRKSERRIILNKIKELVDNSKYFIVEFDEKGKINSKRKIDFKDICILSRDKSFGLELQREALKNNIPMNYEGGLEIFSTQHGILILAWLKLLLWKNEISAWIPILEAENYSHSEITKIIRGETKEDRFTCEKIPAEILQFIDELKSKDSVLLQAEAVLKKYNLKDEIGNRLITIISQLMSSDFLSLNELVKTIEDSARLEYDIELINTDDAVSVMTIHKSKGLEFPVVILANCNQKIFPSTKGESDSIIFDEVLGLRNKKVFGEKNGYKYVFNNWKTDLSLCVTKSSEYDEERRLFYVAATRAKQYLYFTASRPSQFFIKLAEKNDIEAIENYIYDKEIKIKKEQKKSEAGISALKNYSSNEDDEFDSSEPSEFETSFRRYVRRLASGINILPEIENEADEMKQAIVKFDDMLYELKRTAGQIVIDAEFHFPHKNGVSRGVIEIAVFKDDSIEFIIIGDEERDAKKLEFYKHAMAQIHKMKNVSGRIYSLKAL
ncbi:MAG: UvrD-helicase domain-containing protein [Bacteroidetes bacterium]|nr:UvrD-helicase domain-containing protein [Bacteroidota bacterium]